MSEDYRDLRKQIGCMNGILQLLDRQHFLTSRRKKNGHDQKRLIQGVRYKMDSHNAEQAVTDRDIQREKANSRISTETSPASHSSSSSSTFSSLDHNKSAQPETARDINTERTMQIKPIKEQQPPFNKGIRFNDLQIEEKFPKGGGEVRDLSVKSPACDERKRNSIKHIDSPRPVLPFQPEKQTSTVYERSDRTLVKVQEYRTTSKEERVFLPSRFSYDGIELQERFKSNTKHKEIPRLSLDSKSSSRKCSVPETHSSSSSSIVTKLMGLDVFPDHSIPVESSTPTVKSCYKEAFLSQFTSKTDESGQKQVTCSPRVSQKDPTATSSRRLCNANSQKKSMRPTIHVERVPRGQEDSTQEGIPTMSLQTKNGQANLLDKSFSVYGEIEKRITELEFRKSDKNLRALKQILDAMHKPKETMYKHGKTGESISAWKNTRSYYLRKQQSETRDPKSRRVTGYSYLALKKNSRDSENLPTLNKKANRSELERTTAAMQHVKAAKCTTSNKSLGTVGLRLQQTKLRREEQPKTPPSSDSGWPEKHPQKKFIKASHPNRKHQSKNTSLQQKDDQLSDIGGETKYVGDQADAASVKSESNYSILSQTESEIMSLASSTNVHVKQKRDSELAGEHKPTEEISTTTPEQPSPVSVLDDTLYSEDLPSPVKTTSRSFREDESQTSAEAEWHYKEITSCRRPDSGYTSNQKLGLKNSGFQQRLEVIKTGDTVGRHKALAYDTMNPDHTYVNKILVALGVLKESSSISLTDHFPSSCRLINPEKFHILEQTEDTMEGSNGQFLERTSRMMVKEKVHRKIIFDVVNEILFRKIFSGRFLTGEKRSMSTQSLLKEVYLEIDQISRMQKSYRTDDEDQMTKLLTADMAHKHEDWANYNSETQALVLDVERLIFKDLINEIVIGEVLALHDGPKKHCRQLFKH